MTSIHVDHAAEVCDRTGPTGRFVRVLRGEVLDAGCNILFAGTADECEREYRAWSARMPVSLSPTEVEVQPAGVEIASAGTLWGFASE